MKSKMYNKGRIVDDIDILYQMDPDRVLLNPVGYDFDGLPIVHKKGRTLQIGVRDSALLAFLEVSKGNITNITNTIHHVLSEEYIGNMIYDDAHAVLYENLGLVEVRAGYNTSGKDKSLEINI